MGRGAGGTRHDVGDAGSEGVEMGDDPKMGQEAEASGASFAGVPKCGHPRRQCHRPGAAAGREAPPCQAATTAAQTTLSRRVSAR